MIPFSVANDIEVFEVTGSHFNVTNMANPLPSVTLSEQEIKALAPNSFADVLRGLPGVDISQQGGMSGLTFLSIRGGDPNFVTVLIDGVKVNDPTNSRGGAFDLGTLDPNVIEKVEVFYGSYSSVYGSDALAGVISIQTKRAEQEPSANATVKLGNHAAKGASLYIGLPVDDFADLNLSASWQDGDASEFGDAFQRKALIASMQSNNDSDTQWNLSGFYTQGEGQYFPEDSGGDRLAVIRTPESRDYTQSNLATQIYHSWSEKLKLTLDAAYSKREEILLNPGIAEGQLDAIPPIDSDTFYKRIDINAVANYQFSDTVIGALGLTLSEEDGGMQSVIDFGVLIDADYSIDRTTNSIFAEVDVKPSTNSNVSVGLRHDKTDLLSVYSKRMLANIRVSKATELSGQYSEGFKLPSFYALGHPLVGNSELQPERSKNIELSVNQQLKPKTLSTKFSIYQNTYKNLVDFDPEAFTNVNRSKIRIRGAELSAIYQVSDKLNLNAQISYTDVNTFDPAINLRRRPDYKGSVRSTYQHSPNLSFTARYSINGDFYDSSIPTGSIELDGFDQLDLSAHWQMRDNFEWRLHLSNALDSQHEEAVGFVNTGPQVTLSLSSQI